MGHLLPHLATVRVFAEYGDVAGDHLEWRAVVKGRLRGTAASGNSGWGTDRVALSANEGDPRIIVASHDVGEHFGDGVAQLRELRGLRM